MRSANFGLMSRERAGLLGTLVALLAVSTPPASAHFRVLDPVINDFALDRMRIWSDYADFDVTGQVLLMIRLHEIQALAVLDEQTELDLAGRVVVRQVQDSWDGIVQLATEPVETVKGIPSGILRRFKSFGRDVVDIVHALHEASDQGRHIELESTCDRPAPLPQGLEDWTIDD